MTNSETTARAPRSAEIEALLDAAEACLQRYGLAKMTVEDVAQAAGLSRATVYRQVGNRDALVLSVAARNAERLAAEAIAYLIQLDQVGDWIVEGLLFCVREIPNRPVLAEFVSPQALATSSRLVLTSDRMLAIGSEILRPMFETALGQGLLHEELELDAVIEWVLRILMSLLAVPGPTERSEDDLRRLLQTMLLPAVLSGSHSDPNR